MTGLKDLPFCSMSRKSLGRRGVRLDSQSGNSFSVTWPRGCGSRQPVFWQELLMKLCAVLLKLAVRLKCHWPVVPLPPVVFCALLALPGSAWGSAPAGNIHGPTGSGWCLRNGLMMGEIVCSSSFRLPTRAKGLSVAWLAWGRRSRVKCCWLEPVAWTGGSWDEGMLGNSFGSACIGARLRPSPVLTSASEPGRANWCRTPGLLLLLQPSIAWASWIVILATWWPLVAFEVRWMTDKSSVPLLLPDNLSLLSPALEMRLMHGSLVPKNLTLAAGGALRSADRRMESPWLGPDLVGAAAAWWVTRPVLVASVSARSLFFWGLELVEVAGDWVEVIEGEEEVEEEDGAVAAAAALIRSDSFCFFFFTVAELLGDCEGENGTSLCKDAAGVLASWNAFLLFFDCCVAPTSSDLSETSGEDFSFCRNVSLRAGGLLEFAAALQCGRWLLSLLYVFPQNGHTSEGGREGWVECTGRAVRHQDNNFLMDKFPLILHFQRKRGLAKFSS